LWYATSLNIANDLVPNTVVLGRLDVDALADISLGPVALDQVLFTAVCVLADR
jgi:hypothetical protein